MRKRDRKELKFWKERMGRQTWEEALEEAMGMGCKKGERERGRAREKGEILKTG